MFFLFLQFTLPVPDRKSEDNEIVQQEGNINETIETVDSDVDLDVDSDVDSDNFSEDSEDSQDEINDVNIVIT